MNKKILILSGVILACGFILCPTIPAEEETRKGLSAVKVAVVYEKITDGETIGRGFDKVVEIFNETKTDLIFRSFFRWNPVPQSLETAMPGFSADYIHGRAKKGYTYQQYGEAITETKKKLPCILIIGQ